MSDPIRDPNHHRPRYHFTTDHWMNDPIPFVAPDGAVHVWYQHNPNDSVWGDMHWGHAVSRDLARWECLPIGLAPTPGGPDHDGVWTGCVVRRDDDRFAALYTGIPTLKPFAQVQCLAVGDDLMTWEKWPHNPLDAPQPDGYGSCFRDPQAWRTADGTWLMVIGGEQTEKRGGAAFLYRAEDAELSRWTFLHPLFEGGPETGHDFECPDFFPLGDGDGDGGDRHLLITSRNQTWWHAGRLGADLRFSRDAWGVCDGGHLYAAKTGVDANGRRLLFGWIREDRPDEAMRAAGWSGALSLPRVVTAAPDGTPRFTPAPQVESLRGARVGAVSVQAGAGQAVVVPGISGHALELLVRFTPTDAARYGVVVRRAADGSDGCVVAYDAAARTLGAAPLPLAPGEPLALRVFVDGSVVEVYDAAGRACHTFRTYPETPDSVGVAVFAEGGPVSATVMAWDYAG